MIFGHESKMLQISQKFHFNNTMYCKSSVTVLTLTKGMSVIFQEASKQVLLKHCNSIASSLEVVGRVFLKQFSIDPALVCRP